MPRLVDHEVRRRQITDAVRRVIVTGGLEAVTYQSVAAEAAISIRLVQYYFGTKNEFLLATHRSVMHDAGARFPQRWTALRPEATPREAIHAVLTELLPLDEQRREEVIVLNVFATAAIAGRGITAEETFAAPHALVSIVTDQLRRTRSSGRSGTNIPERDAELITMTIGGLAHAMLQNFIAPQSALELIDHLLDRVLETNTADTDSTRSASH